MARRCLVAVFAILAAPLFPSLSRAQPKLNAASHFVPLPGSKRLSALSLSATEDPYQWVVNLHYGYAKSPLLGDSAGLTTTRNLVSHQHTIEVHALVGLPWVELGVAIPLIVDQTGEPWTDSSGQEHEGVKNFAMGDLRVHAKVRLLDPRRFKFGIGVGLDLATPTGEAQKFAGSPNVVFTGRLVLDYWIKDVATLALNLGYTVRAAERLEDLEIADELWYGFGLMFRFGDLGLPVNIFVEFVGSTAARHPFGDQLHSPLEARFGFRIWSLRAFFAEVAWGIHLVDGYGLPRYRAMVDVGFVFDTPGTGKPRRRPKDRDGDGVVDQRDRCPDKPEDLDDFEDSDGCPEPGKPTPPKKDLERYPPPKPRWWQRWKKRQARWKAARKKREAARRKRDVERRARAAARSAGDRERQAERERLKKRLKRVRRTVKKISDKVRKVRRPGPRRRVRPHPAPRPQ